MEKKFKFFNKLKESLKAGIITEKNYNIILNFFEYYQKAIKRSKKDIDYICLFETFLTLIYQQIKTNFQFECYHKKTLVPFDYYTFGINFFIPLINHEKSFVLGKENLIKIKQILDKKENVVLFANHQTESDPQVIDILLEKDFKSLTKKIIYIAGERVTSDLLAIPFSKGVDLICIYSKKYIQEHLEEKRKRQLHNKKAITILLKEILNEGGNVIFVAPSGGRDRENEKGVIKPDLFDYQSVEMFYFISQKSIKKTHFFPLSLFTYKVLPPPRKIQVEMGEKRIINYTPVCAYFGKEINMQMGQGMDKLEIKKIRAHNIWKIVNDNYEKIIQRLVNSFID